MANSELSDEFDLVASQVILVDKGIKDNDLNKMVDEIENVESVNLVLSPSQLSDLAIPDEMIPDDVKDIFESDRYKMIFVNSTEEIATNKLNKVIDKIDHIIKKYDKNAIMAGEGPCMKDLVNIADEDFRNVSIASIGIIFIIMLFVLKSVSLPVLLVSGIELAIFINMAISYYTGMFYHLLPLLLLEQFNLEQQLIMLFYLQQNIWKIEKMVLIRLKQWIMQLVILQVQSLFLECHSLQQHLE